MEIPLPHKRGSRSVRLNYNHSIDLAVYYDFDSAKITGETADVLDDLGAALATTELDGSRYLVAGHTDSAGSEGYNQWLSERRALSAKRYLVEHYRIDPERLVVVGFGETRLADRRRPKDGINRRVEITLIADDYSGPTSESFRAPDTSYLPRGASEPTAEELGLVEYEGPSSADIDCDAASRLQDPRPTRTGLDDFGSRRTPVPCGDPPDDAAAAAPVALPPVAEPQEPVEPVEPVNPAAGQNSAIQN
ncbi:OmpA family protein [Aurantimonas sp. VKM B-3413]|nr:OmpA family protein [Aurantimonas sp. VKM B-3413]